MNNLYFYTWNNYYNRQYKGQPTVESMEEYKVGDIANANFSVNDGVNTFHVIQTVDWLGFSGIPDYLIVADLEDNVVSRWFVVEADKYNGAQYRVSLRRDLITDFYESYINAPAFIEKATLRTTDPLIWNSE